MSKFHIWGDLPPVTFRTPPTDKAEQKTPAQHIAALEISLVLREIGKDPIAIDTPTWSTKICGLQNLQAFGSTGDGFAPPRHEEQDKTGAVKSEAEKK